MLLAWLVPTSLKEKGAPHTDAPPKAKMDRSPPEGAGGAARNAGKLGAPTTTPSIFATPANLQTRGRFCTNATSRWRRTPGSTGLRNFTPSIDMK